jgi:hypothetical protein
MTKDLIALVRTLIVMGLDDDAIATVLGLVSSPGQNGDPGARKRRGRPRKELPNA